MGRQRRLQQLDCLFGMPGVRQLICSGRRRDLFILGGNCWRRVKRHSDERDYRSENKLK
jgi:hypothetical protein